MIQKLAQSTPFDCPSPIPVSDWAGNIRKGAWKPHDGGSGTQHMMVWCPIWNDKDGGWAEMIYCTYQIYRNEAKYNSPVGPVWTGPHMKCALSSDWALHRCNCCMHARVEAVLLDTWCCLQIRVLNGTYLICWKEERMSAGWHKKESASTNKSVCAGPKSKSDTIVPMQPQVWIPWCVPGWCYLVVLQQVLEVYGSILAGTHWKGCWMGGASTEITPVGWRAGYDGNWGSCW